MITAPPLHIAQNNHFRDPKVWKHQDAWYMVLGGMLEGRGKVLLYSSTNLVNWHYVSIVTESDGTMGYMYACPDFFHIAQTEVLMFCPEGASQIGEPRTSGYYLGNLNYAQGKFEMSVFRKLDHGFDFYAPQTTCDDQGRRILMGWMPMDGLSVNKQWAGVRTIPREITLDDQGKIKIRPVTEMKRLRKKPTLFRDLTIEADELQIMEQLAGDGYEIIIEYDVSATTAEAMGLSICSSREGQDSDSL